LKYRNKYLKEHYVQRRIRRDLYEKLVEWCGEESINMCLEKLLNTVVNRPSQESIADPDPGAYERLADVLKRVVDAVKRHEEMISRLNERVDSNGARSLWHQGILTRLYR
jgi:hypothetical protein